MKKIILISFLFLMALLKSYGQVLIGNGSELEGLPINPYYGYSYSQSIYTAAEINANGSITSLSWYFGGPQGSTLPNSQSLKIYLGHTTKTSYNSGSDWVTPSNLTEVYSGSIVINGQGWASVTFTTPFAYNGVDNLVIATAELQAGYDSNGDYFTSQPMGENRSLLYQSDGTPPDLVTLNDGGLKNLLPNIILGGIVNPCPTPFFLNTVNKTANSAIVVWGNGVQNPEDSSEYYLSTNEQDPSSDTAASGLSTNIAMLSDLEPNTVYYIWVRNVCNGAPGAWSYPTSFQTECNAVTIFTENFDTTLSETLPSCWSSIISGSEVSNYASVKTIIGSSYTGSNSVELSSSDSGENAQIILISPKITLSGNDHRLRFFANGAEETSFVIGTLNTNSPSATFTPLENGSFNTYGAYSAYELDLSTYTGSDSYIGIKLSTESNYKTIQLDNIRLEPNTTCADVADISIEGIQPQELTVNWSSQGTTAWEIAFTDNPELANPAQLTSVLADSSNYLLNELSPNTNYNLWVRSKCESENGAWIGPVNFTTLCPPIADFTENFDTATVPSLPTCWRTLTRNIQPNQYVNIATAGYSLLSAPNQIILTAGSNVTANTSKDVVLISPNLSTVSMGTHRLKFMAKGTANLQVGIIDGVGTTANFMELEEIIVSDAYQEYVVDFSNYQVAGSFFAIRVNSTAPYQTSYIDNVTWEISPLCPDVSNLLLENVTDATAHLSWSDNDTNWNVVVGTAGSTDPSAILPIFETTANTIQLQDLQDNTLYNAWVRTVCGSENGAWIGPLTFKTDCIPTTSFNEDFDTSQNLPTCWTSIVRGPGTSATNASIKVNANNPHSPTNSVQLYNSNQTDENDVILVSPNLSNLGAGTNRLKFYSSYYYASAIEVGTLDSNSANAQFTVLQEIEIGSTYTEYTVNFEELAGTTDRYIGIRLSATMQNSYAYIDDLRWEPAPLCPSLTNPLISDVSDTSASVSWNLPISSTVAQVAYSITSTQSPEDATLLEPASSEYAFLTDLMPNTSYKVWIRSVCSSDNGEWIGPMLFTTSCTAVTALSENFENLTAPNLPDCWTKITDGSSSQYFASITTTSTTGFSSSNALKITNSSNASIEKVRLIAPPISNLASGTHQLTFYLKGSVPISGIQVGTLTNPNSTGEFTNVATISATTSFTKVTVDFSNYTGSDYLICIWHSGNNNSTIYIDDFKWEPLSIENCVALSDFSEDFESSTLDSVPACWASVLRGPTSLSNIDAIGVKTDVANAPSGSRVLNLFKGLSGSSDEQIIILPQLLNLNQGTHSLRFYHAGPPCEIEIGSMNSNTADGTFTLRETVSVEAEWTQSVIDFSNYTGSDTYIAIRLKTSETPFISMYLDDVMWSPVLKVGNPNDYKFSYHPNPVKDKLTISSEKDISEISIINSLGQKIYQQLQDSKEVQLDFSQLANGIYIVQVTSDSSSRTLKIVKN